MRLGAGLLRAVWWTGDIGARQGPSKRPWHIHTMHVSIVGVPFLLECCRETPMSVWGWRIEMETGSVASQG